MDNECPLCLNPAHITRSSTGFQYNVFCEVCGEYSISYPVADSDELQYHEKRYILSAVARNRYEQGKEPLEILELTDIKTILDSVSEPSPVEAVDLLLKYLRRKGGKASEPVQLENDYSIVFAKDRNEFDNYLRMAHELGYIEHRKGGRCYKLKTEGWLQLDKLDKLAEQEPSREIDLGETEGVLDRIKKGIEASSLEEDFKEIALYDLEQAKLTYRSGAFKACIVMLGAVLEGLMLGTIRRPEVLQRIKPNPPEVVKKLGLHDPQLADKIAEKLTFEDYKAIIHHLMPEIEELKVEGIQTFRNTIHPWKTVKEPAIYKDPSQIRAMVHLTSLQLLAQHILSWTP
jgi:hypothetical protein